MRYGFEWTPGLVLLGLVVILPLAPAFAMIGLLLVAVAAVAAVIALAGAVLATPYLLVRTVRRHLAEGAPMEAQMELSPATGRIGFGGA